MVRKIKRKKANSTASSFARMNKPDTALHGPRGLLLCGYEPREQNMLLGLLVHLQIPAPVRFPGEADADRTLHDLFADLSGQGRGEARSLPRAVIFSGLKESEVQRFMTTYRETGLERPLWAALTPLSEKWDLQTLLAELSEERTALQD